jgi:hypothetical protein
LAPLLSPELWRKITADRANAATVQLIGGPLKLQINPQSRVTAKPRVEQILEDACGALYAVQVRRNQGV